MRLGVIDVGSNTVHLLVVDAHPGAHPLPAFSHKRELRLAEHMDGDLIAEAGAAQLTEFIAECVEISEDQGVQELLAFATSAIREADNTEDVLAQVRAATGVDLRVLSGDAESRLTFLAVRRWLGWSAGRILLLDIGGGSLEIATGIDEDADAAVSLPLGAGRLSRQLRSDPPAPEELRALRRRVRADIGTVVRDITRFGEAHRVVGSSKTFRALARACGAAPSAEGIYVRRCLQRDDLADLVARLAEMPASKRAALPGISTTRAGQMLAGAVVAEAAMDLFDVDTLEISPWALREGVILNRLDRLDIAPA